MGIDSQPSGSLQELDSLVGLFHDARTVLYALRVRPAENDRDLGDEVVEMARQLEQLASRFNTVTLRLRRVYEAFFVHGADVPMSSEQCKILHRIAREMRAEHAEFETLDETPRVATPFRRWVRVYNDAVSGYARAHLDFLTALEARLAEEEAERTESTVWASENAGLGHGEPTEPMAVVHARLAK